MNSMSEVQGTNNKGKTKFPLPEITFKQVTSANVINIYKEKHVNGYPLAQAAKRNTPDLTAIQKLILSEISEYADASGRCHPSQKNVAHTLNLDRSTVVESIKFIRQKGYISDVKNTGRGYIYLLNAPKLMSFKITSDVVVDNISCSPGQHKHNKEHTNGHTTSLTATDTNTSQRAGTQAAHTPTGEPSEPLANCAQQSRSSFADGASPLAQSATPIVPPLSAYGHSIHATKVSNTYYCEDRAP